MQARLGQQQHGDDEASVGMLDGLLSGGGDSGYAAAPFRHQRPPGPSADAGAAPAGTAASGAAGGHKRGRVLPGAEPLYNGPRHWPSNSPSEPQQQQESHGQHHRPAHGQHQLSPLHHEVGVSLLVVSPGPPRSFCGALLHRLAGPAACLSPSAPLPLLDVSPPSFQVEAFARHAHPTPPEMELLSKGMAAIDSAARGLWPHARTKLFGSQVGGYDIPGRGDVIEGWPEPAVTI